MMTEYVCGFLFAGNEVLLQRKARPRWQAGRYNGMGGHIEPDETPLEAMAREAREEIGLEIDWGVEWQHRVTLGGSDWRVHFFRAFTSTSKLLGAKLASERTDEPCAIFSIEDLPRKVLPNLLWLIPMVLDEDLLPAYIQDRSVDLCTATLAELTEIPAPAPEYTGELPVETSRQAELAVQELGAWLLAGWGDRHDEALPVANRRIHGVADRIREWGEKLESVIEALAPPDPNTLPAPMEMAVPEPAPVERVRCGKMVGAYPGAGYRLPCDREPGHEGDCLSDEIPF